MENNIKNIMKNIKNVKKAKNPKYVFQKRKVYFTRKLFEGGFNAANYLLLGLADLGESFVDDFIGGLPNSYPQFKLMKMVCGCDSHKRIKELKKNTIKMNIARLKQQGLIAEGENKKIHLTEDGKKMILYIKDRFSILEKLWDNKIRVVVFDIPEKKDQIRRWLRDELLLMQFKELQKSVYVGKFPMADETYKDLAKYEIFENVHIFTINEADKMEEIIKFLEDEEKSYF